MPKPSSATIVQIVRVAGSRSMRAEIVPALSAVGPLSFMFPRLPWPARMPRAFGPPLRRALTAWCQIRSQHSVRATVGAGGLSLAQHCAVDAPWTATGKGEIEKHKTEWDRGLTAIGDRIEGAGRV